MLLKRAIKKYGKDNFKKIILKEFDTEEEARNYERHLINQLNAIENENFYNLVVGGYGGGVRKHPVSDKTKKKISEKHLGKKLSRNQVVGMGKPTLQYDLNGLFIKEFETKADAEKIMGFKMTKLSGDKTIYIKGFLWKYKNGKIEDKILDYKSIKNQHKINISKQVGKLTKEEVINLIKDKDLGLTYIEISNKYGISQSCAYEIVTGKTYNWVFNE